MKHLTNVFKVGLFSAFAVVLAASPTFAATKVINPNNLDGWKTAYMQDGGAANYVGGAPEGLGQGSLQLTTTDSADSKISYGKEANLPLRDFTDGSYWTKQVAASFEKGAASYQMVVFLNGGTDGFTTLVYEPYLQDETVPGVVNGQWQKWDVDAGKFWSTRNVKNNSGGQIGESKSNLYTLTDIKTLFPDAVIAGYGVNVGSGNPDYVINVDGFTFNDTTYNFGWNRSEIKQPKAQDDCKKNQWQNLKNADGEKFKNQGQCVSYAVLGNAFKDADQTPVLTQ